MFSCNNCLREYKNRSGLEKHAKKECEKVILNTDGTIQNKQRYQCDYCYIIITTSYRFDRHQEICKKFKKYKIK